jgi:4-hydroxybenzoate polyprenyltransferase
VFYESPYISILKLKGSIVDLSVAAATCSILGVWDYRVIVVAVASVMIHSGCDVLNDIYDLEIDKICKPDGAIASGRIPLRKAWAYMMLLFSASLALLLGLGPIVFLSAFAGILIGGVLYSHPLFRLKDKPGIAMAAMALCFALESIGIWSMYAPIDASALMVAAYVFVLVFSLTFMKDFKDVAGDVSSLPLVLGPRRAAKVCCALALLPLVPMVSMAIRHNSLFLAVIVYMALVAGCIKILLGDPVKDGVRLKNWMILALTLPNFIMLL